MAKQDECPKLFKTENIARIGDFFWSRIPVRNPPALHEINVISKSPKGDDLRRAWSDCWSLNLDFIEITVKTIWKYWKKSAYLNA